MDELRTIRRLATLAVALLVATVALDLVVVGFDVVEISLLNDLMNAIDVPLSSLEASDARQAAGATTGLVLLVLTGLAFIAWFHAVAVRVQKTGRLPLRHSTGWSLGAWFVPFLNLVRPKQIADDLWAASGPPATTPDGRSLDDGPRLLGRWWALWVVATVGDILVSRLSVTAQTADGLRTSATFDLVVLLVDIAAAVYAIRVVRALTARVAGEQTAPEAAVEAAAA